MKTTMDITVFRRENLRRDPLELFEHDGNYESIVRPHHHIWVQP